MFWQLGVCDIVTIRKTHKHTHKKKIIMVIIKIFFQNITKSWGN